MDDGYSLVSIIIFIGFILLDAAFYGFGSAVQNLNVGNLEKDAEEGDQKAARLLQIIDRPARFIYTVQVSATLIGMITGAFVLDHLKVSFLRLFTEFGNVPEGFRMIFSQILMGLLLLLVLISFGIIIPKKCAARKPKEWAYQMFPVISCASIPLRPFTWAVSGISYVILKLLGIDPSASEDNVTEEDIMSMVNEGHEQGVLEASEAEMITNIFELDDKEAGDIMTHRKNLVALDGELTLRAAVTFILTEGNNSRYPVYEKDVDNIIGILHLKDAVIYSEQEEYKEQKISAITGLLREAHFIPETRNINSLFKEMQSQKIHMEVVVDEYGQTAGVVTMEDILEEIVGNIMDEYDEEETFIVAGEDGTFLMNGMTPLDEAAEALGIEFEEEEYDSYDTVNGFLISKLDRIPQEDEHSEVMYQDFVFKILKVENKMIHTIRVARVPKENDPEGEAAGEIFEEKEKTDSQLLFTGSQ